MYPPHAHTHTPQSGLVQPPVHAIAAWHLAQVAGDTVRDRLRELYPRLFAWHRYLVSNRDPDGQGLIVVYHPWESMDNSPRFDAALGRIEVGNLPPYKRRDTGHIQDKSQRPTDAEYDRFLWLVNLMKASRYNDEAIQKTLPLLVRDVFFSGIFAGANHALSELAGWLGIDSDRADLDAWATRYSQAVQKQWDPSERLALDHDIRAN